MARTITSVYHSGISLGTADNPLLITGGEGFVVYNATAISGDSSQAWTITNQGTVNAAFYGTGTSLGGAGSTVQNSGTGALIHGYYGGVALNGGGTVVNDGTIVVDHGHGVFLNGGSVTNTATGLVQAWDTAIYLDATGSVFNQGTLSGSTGGGGTGVRLVQGGTVTNGTGTAASITGATGVDIGYGPVYVSYGVYASGGAGTVVNAGTITGTSASGIHLRYGGSIDNQGSVHAYSYGILIENQAGTVDNDGIITAGFQGVRLLDAAGTVTNSGTISASFGSAVYLADGGSVSNTGSLHSNAGGSGVRIVGQSGTVTNSGSIDGHYGGIRLKAGGTVSNLGTAASVYAYSAGIYVYTGGTVTNEGTVTTTGFNSDAVWVLGGGGFVNNSGTAAILKGYDGVRGDGGQLTVINEGTITGTSANAIYLHDGGTITNSGTLIGGVKAHDAPTITNTGTIINDNDSAVQLFEGGEITNGAATITGAGVTGYGIGILVEGAAGTITNFGTISAHDSGYPFTAGVGLVKGGSVINGSPASTAALISSGGYGVRIGDSSTSVGTVTNDGTIIGGTLAGGPRSSYGPFSAGVRLLDGGTVTNGTGTNTSATISGSFGVYTGHYYNAYPLRGFTGTATVLNAGTIIGVDRSGVALYAGGSVTNSGFTTGYTAGVAGAWHPITVTNDGTITGTGTGGSSYGIGVTASSYYDSSVTNGSPTNHAALIEGASYGVYLHDRSTVENHGTIRGVTFSAVEISSGTVTNAAGGLIAGGQQGVYMERPGSVINDGTISGATGAGIKLSRGTSVTNGIGGNASATISGTIGVQMGFNYTPPGGTIYGEGAGVVSNAGTILGIAAGTIGYGFPGDSGIGVLLAAGGSVDNSGYIHGDFSGVRIAYAAGTVSNTGSIHSEYYGVQLQDVAGTVINHGEIIAGVGLEFRAGGTVANLGTGAAITGLGYGIGVYVRSGATGTVTNEGTITGRFGVYLHDGGTVTNSGTSALISSPNDIAIRAGSAGAITIANDGTISGDYSAIRMSGGGSVTNGGTANATAAISGGQYGIVARTLATTVTNYGSITSGSGIAIYLKQGGSVTNSGTAAYIGGVFGIYGASGAVLASVAVTNEGTIAGSAAGVGLLSGGDVTNSGTASAITASGAGIVLARAGTILNEGTVRAYGYGVTVGYGRVRIVNGSATDTTARIEGAHGASFTDASGVVVNFGTIAGYASGVAFLDRNGVVNNRGVIEAPGGTIAGYGVVLGKGGALINSGTITGTYGVVAGYPCGCSPGGAVTVTNSGTIIGTGGIAVQLGDFDDTVAVRPGAVFGGAVIAGAGNDTLVLLAAGSVGTISGIGSDFTGFETISLPSTASRWSLTGTSTLADGSLIGVAGRLTVAGQLSVPGTLHIAGPGTLAAGATGAIEIGTAGGAATGRITIDADGRLVGSGTLRGPVMDRGTIEASGGTLVAQGNVGGAGTIAIAAGAVLDARANLSVRHVVFAGAGTDETLLAKAGKVTGTISGFADHDAIDLTNFVADDTLTSFASDVLTLHELGGPGMAALHFDPGYSLGDFIVAPAGLAGTSITHA